MTRIELVAAQTFPHQQANVKTGLTRRDPSSRITIDSLRDFRSSRSGPPGRMHQDAMQREARKTRLGAVDKYRAVSCTMHIPILPADCRGERENSTQWGDLVLGYTSVYWIVSYGASTCHHGAVTMARRLKGHPSACLHSSAIVVFDDLEILHLISWLTSRSDRRFM